MDVVWKTLTDAEIDALLERGPIIATPPFYVPAQPPPEEVTQTRSHVEEDGGYVRLGDFLALADFLALKLDPFLYEPETVDEITVDETDGVRTFHLSSAIKREVERYKNTVGRTRVARRRRQFITYRLWRHHHLREQTIAYLLSRPVEWVREQIRLAFKEMCMNDRECVFKPYLKA